MMELKLSCMFAVGVLLERLSQGPRMQRAAAEEEADAEDATRAASSRTKKVREVGLWASYCLL